MGGFLRFAFLPSCSHADAFLSTMRDSGDIARVARMVGRSGWYILRTRGGVPADSCCVLGRLSIGIMGGRAPERCFACGRGVVSAIPREYDSTTTPKSVAPMPRGAWEAGSGQKTRRVGIHGAYT